MYSFHFMGDWLYCTYGGTDMETAHTVLSISVLFYSTWLNGLYCTVLCCN